MKPQVNKPQDGGAAKESGSNSLTVAIAGLGSRGREVYGKFALERGVKVTAVADANPARVREASEVFGIPEDRCFGTAGELLDREKLADALFICTPDEDHFCTSMKAIEKGYHLLLEKPVATKESHCAEIARAAAERGRHVVVCHVLRYTPLYRMIKEVIDSGVIGEIITVDALEGVGYYHQAHSFVRGVWADTKASSPMILAKCCHDVDILVWLLEKRAKSVSSYGGLSYFRKENAPEGAAERCMSGCRVKDTCPYDAEKIYISNEKTGVDAGNTGWPATVLVKPVTPEGVREAVRTGPYGRCVFHCGNDAVDHQVVNMEFEGGVTAHLTMTAFTPGVYRTIRVMGTLGMVGGDTRTGVVRTHVFGEQAREEYTKEDFDKGHGGGDIRLFEAFTKLVTTGESDASLTTAQRSVESHLICFAAERSRLNGGAPEGM